MTTASEAVATLYTLVDKDPYRTSQSWVTTKEFVESYTDSMGKQAFQLDLTLLADTSNDKKRH